MAERSISTMRPGIRQRPAILRYGVAAIVVVAATLLRQWLSDYIGPFSVPFMTYFLAVTVAAWYGGFGPGFLTTLAGAVGALYYFVPPANEWKLGGIQDELSAGIFIFIGTIISGISESLQNSQRRERWAADELREQTELLRVTLASIGDAVIATNVEERVSFINDAAASLIGEQPENLLGKDLTEVFRVVNEITREPIENPVSKVLKENWPIGLANHAAILRRDGGVTPIEDSASPIRSATGEVLGVILVFRDVTEARKAEAAKLAGLRRYEYLAESIPQMVWTLTAEGKVDYANRRWREYVGDAPLEEFAMESIVHPGDISRTTREFESGLKRGIEFEFESRLRRQDGVFRWHLHRAVPMRNEDGAIIKWFGTSTDIDDQKKVQSSLEFIVRTVETLMETLDYERNIQRVAEFAVPTLADWCAVDLLTEDNELRHVALVHSDPRKIDAIERYRETHPLSPDDDTGVWKVIKTGEPELYKDIPEELLRASVPDDEDFGFVMSLQLRSVIVAPLVAREKVLGALTLAYAESGRHYNEQDLDIAELIARRCALAIENSRLYTLAQEQLRDRMAAEEEANALAAEMGRQRMRLNDILETVPGVVWEAWGQPDDRRQRIDFVSNYVEEMLGYSVHEWLSEPNFWLKIVHPEDKERAAREAAAIFKSKGSGVSTFRWLRKDGRPLWVEARSIVMLDEENQPVGMRGVTFDVSERKQAEDSIRFTASVGEALSGSLELEQTLHKAANLAVPDFSDWCIIYLLDATGEPNCVASAFFDPNDEALFRRVIETGAHESNVGHKRVIRTGEAQLVTDFNSEVEKEVAQNDEDLEAIHAAGINSYICVPLKTSDKTIGAVTFIQTASRRQFTPNDLRLADVYGRRVAVAIENATLYRSAKLEIAERQAVEQKLRENREQLQAILDYSPAAIYIVDIEGRYILVNKRCEELLERPKEEIVGKTDVELFPQEIASKFSENTRRAAETKRPVEQEEEIIAYGERRYHMTVKFPLLTPSGEVYAVCGISTDVTQSKRLEEQLLQAQKMESVGRLAGGVAHDFNNLLTAVIGYAELAEMKLPEDSAVTRDVRQIRKAGERAAKLTSQLLAFARKQVIEPRLVNINDLLPHLRDMLRPLVGEDVAVMLQEGPLLWPIKADPGQIEQVIVNLVVNARDAMPHGGVITISTENTSLEFTDIVSEGAVPAGDYVLLTVSDTGHGMEQDVRERIFDPFFTTKEKGKGTGLGLATCYGIIKQNGGHITVESALGVGSTFKLFLPRAHESYETTSEESEMQHHNGAGATILLAEDEEAVRDLAALTLRNFGYEVLEAANGYEALQVARNYPGKIDLLLTDVIMPRVGGRELAERIHEERPDVKVMFMSGYTDGAVLEVRELERGVVFMQKPFTPAQLASRIRERLAAEI